MYLMQNSYLFMRCWIKPDIIPFNTLYIIINDCKIKITFIIKSYAID